MAACGPISLDPGERNEIVFGVVWARGEEGPASSVQALFEADDRIQALFDNCFEGLGCSDPLATNYEEDAFFGSDGACTYPPLVCGEALPSTYLANLNEVSLVTDSVVVGFGEGPDAIEFIVAAGDSLMLFQTSGLPPGLSVDVDEVWPSGQFVCIQPTGLPSTLGGFSSTWSFLIWEDGVPSELVFSLWWEVGFSALDADDIELVSLPLTRIQGRGSGRKTLRLSAESEEAIVMSSNGRIAELTYKAGLGPLDVFVLGDAYPESAFEIEFLSLDDPLETPFELRMLPDGPAYNGTFTPDISLVSFESVGLAVAYDGPAYSSNVEVAEVLGGNVESMAVGTWWEGIPDAEGFVENNWIRSGTQEGGAESAYELVYDDLMDEDELYEGFLGGTWAPYSVVSYTSANVEDPATGQTYEFLPLYAPTRDDLERTQQWNTPEATTSVAVVFTPDRSKWTRCPVLEMQPYDILAQNATGASGTLEKMNLRRHASVDKDGMTAAEGGNATDANFVSGAGMGWFPGYAIDVTSGERLNMAFGEDSWLSADNGKDMLFNPSSSAAYFGGQHWIYVFKNGQLASGSANRMPSYDGGAFIMTQLADPSITNEKRVFRDCAWVGSALSVDGHDWDLPWSEFAIHLDVALPLTEYSPNVASEFANSGEAGVLPLYRFTTENLSGCTDLEAFNFETNALLDDGNCVDAADACLADSLGLIAQLGLTTLPEDTLFWSPETPGFLLSVEGDLEVSPGQFLSLDNARVDSIAGLPDGVSLDGLAPDDILYANTCVELTGLIAGNCYDVEMHLNLEASFFGVTIPAGTAVVEISICSAGAAVFGCTYQHALNFDPMATSDDGACLYVGCTDTEAINFNALFSLDDGSCLYDDLASECIGDIDLNGSVGSSDLLLLLVKFGLSCED